MTFIFCLHYFLWYGAHTTIYGYESVYSRHYTGASTIQFGSLKMVQPFLAVIITPIICSIADRGRSHRAYFNRSLFLALIAMVGFCALPIIVASGLHKQPNHEDLHKSQQQTQLSTTTTPAPAPDPKQNKTPAGLQMGPFIFFALISLLYELAFAVNTCLSDSFAVLQAEESGTSFGKLIVWGTAGWALTGLVLCLVNQFPLLPRLLPGILLGTLMLVFDLLVCYFWRNGADFKLDTIPPSAAITLTGSTSACHQDPNDYIPMNEANRINMGTVEEPDTSSELAGNKQEALAKRLNRFPLRRRTRQTISPVDLLAGKKPQAMNQKQPPGAALKSALGGAPSQVNPSTIKTINSGWDEDNKDEAAKEAAAGAKDEPKAEFVNLNALAEKEAKAQKEAQKQAQKGAKNDQSDPGGLSSGQSSTSFCLQMRLIGLILTRRTVLIRYLVLFTLSGFFMSMHWNYFFLYLEKIYADKFELVSALSMVYQGLLGELPFFILSRRVIDALGRSHTISLSLITISARFLLYRFALPQLSGYLTIVADCLQGPNYGLFYVVMTEVGLEYSFCDDEIIEYLILHKMIERDNKKQVDSIRLALRSTVQSVAFACYEGLGLGLGGLVGGLLLWRANFEVLWLSMAVFALLVGVCNVVVELWFGETGDEEDQVEQAGSDVIPSDVLAKWPSDWRDFHLAQRSGQLELISSVSEWEPNGAKQPRQEKRKSPKSGLPLAKRPREAEEESDEGPSRSKPKPGREAARGRNKAGTPVGKLVADAVAALKIARQGKTAPVRNAKTAPH